MFAGGTKVAKLDFHHSKLRKQTFSLKNLMGKCQISKSCGGLFPPSDAHTHKTCGEKVEEDNKNIFTNKHIMIFENDIH